MITNSDINSDDIKIADIIWGPAESALQVKMKRKKPHNHNRIPKPTLPLSVPKQHEIIIMYIDIVCVNGIPLFFIKNWKTEFLIWHQAEIKER